MAAVRAAPFNETLVKSRRADAAEMQTIQCAPVVCRSAHCYLCQEGLGVTYIIQTGVSSKGENRDV